MATSAPRPGRRAGPTDLERAAGRFRTELAAREERAVAAMVRDLQATARRIDRRMLEVLGKIDSAQRRGRTPGISFLYERGRLEALRRQVAGELRAYGVEVIAQADTLARSAGEAAERWSREFVREAAAGLGIRDADRYVLAPMRPEAIAAARASLQAGSPLADLLDTFGDDGARRVGDALVAGAALGKSPLVVAREIRRDVVETYRGRAKLIARTEAQRTARAVSRDAFASRPDILAGWRWSSSLDRTTCPACWGMHGTLHSLEETLEGHPGCRCVMIPVLRSELARPGLEPQVRDGADVFAELPEDAKLAVLGPGKLRAYQAGEVRLGDLVERRDNPRWGAMHRPASLERARARAAARRAGRAGAPPAPQPAPAPAPPPTPPPAPPAPTPTPAHAQYAPPLRNRADQLERLADELEAHDAKVMREGARKWRDAHKEAAADQAARRGVGRKWVDPAARHKMAGTEGANIGLVQNVRNPATRIAGRDKVLDDYRADWVAWSRGERLEWEVPPGLQPVPPDVLERVTIVEDLRLRAKADRRIADVLTADPDDWRFDARELDMVMSRLREEVEDGQLLVRAATTARDDLVAARDAQRAAARAERAAARRAEREAARAAREAEERSLREAAEAAAQREAAEAAARRAAEEAARPPTRAVSEAVELRFPTVARRAVAQDVLDAVDRVHVVPRQGGPRLPIVQAGRSTRRGGAYTMELRPGGAVPQKITVNQRAGAELMEQAGTLAHELGHHVDHWHLPGIPGAGAGQVYSSRTAMFAARSGRLPNGQAPAPGYADAFVGVYRAILESPTFARLGRVQGAYGRYLRSPEELFARAYAQWIGTRGGHEGIRRTFAEAVARRAEGTDRYGHGLQQWTEEEFVPIADAFDRLFREAGLLR